MSNRMKGEAEIKLGDGRTLKLTFDANAWCEIEDLLDRPALDIIDELKSGRARMKTQRALMWGGLRKHHLEITVEEAGEMLLEAAEEMSKALTGSMPQGEEGEPADGEPGPTRRTRGTGTKH